MDRRWTSPHGSSLASAAIVVLAASCLQTLSGCGGSDVAAPATETPDAAPVPALLSDQIDVSEVAVFQAVKVTIAKDGAPVATRNAPVIAARPGIVRVYVRPKASWKPRMLVAKLRVTDGDKELASITQPLTIRRASTDEWLDSTFTFKLDAEAFTPTASYSLTLQEADGAAKPAAPLRFPEDQGALDLGAKAGSETLRIRIVPVQYQADGSGRSPETSPDQLQTYRDTLFKLYPTANVEVTVRDPLPWASPIDGDGTGWDELLSALMDLRATDPVADDVYYVGAFEPAPSLSKFCRQGCVLGLASLAGATQVSQRAVAIVGYAGTEGPNTLTQELAHAMGRAHAPCGNPDQIDRKFPYADASIGTWGYDLLAEELRDPSEYYDMMSYCQPIWISDYTYSAIFSRLVAVAAAAKKNAAAAPPSPGSGAKAFRGAFADASGALHLGNPVHAKLAAEASKVWADVRGSDGRVTREEVPWIVTDGPHGGFALLPAGAGISGLVITSPRGARLTLRP